jgi:hypothetical protein
VCACVVFTHASPLLPAEEGDNTALIDDGVETLPSPASPPLLLVTVAH